MQMIIAKDPEIYGEIRALADAIARRMCMTWLDDKGIQHCAKCPNTVPLIKLSGVYYCAAHAGQLAKNNGQAAPIILVKG